MLGASVALDDVLELFIDDALAHLQLVQAIEVVKAVAVHQSADLVDKHRVEGFTQNAPGDVHLRQAAQPSVDVLKAVDAIATRVGGAVEGVVEEIQCLVVRIPLGFGAAFGDRAVLQTDQRGGACDVAVERISRNEIHQVVRVDHVGAKVGPTAVFAQADGRAELIECRDADVAATGDVDRSQVQRLAEQALVQRWRDIFVNLVRLLVGHAQGDSGRALLRKQLRGEESSLECNAHHTAGDASRRINQVD